MRRTRVPVGIVFGSDGEEAVVCSDGSVWLVHYGEHGPDGWDEQVPVPGSERAYTLYGDGDTTVAGMKKRRRLRKPPTADVHVPSGPRELR